MYGINTGRCGVTSIYTSIKCDTLGWYRCNERDLPWHFPMTEPKSSLTDLRRSTCVHTEGMRERSTKAKPWHCANRVMHTPYLIATWCEVGYNSR